MSAVLNQVIENIKMLSSDEKALVAHCLILSLDEKQDDDVEQAWAALADRRLAELTSGAVEGVTWDKIKQKIRQ